MGNRVKGRVKKKSVKTASHSSMGSKRKLSRMGKKQKKDHAGLDATFIGRSACLKRLQISLKDFRRLCILKGVYPREPRGRTPSKKKGQVYYHIKDLRALAHEPLLDKFREFKAFMKKVRRSAGRNEKDEAARKDALAPSYTIHHLVKERYPRFMDALGDLDDALSLVYLFAALPSQGRIKSKVTKKAKDLAASWGAYCSTTSSITKSFVSVKGVYLEASVQNSTVRWVIPHAFTQHIPSDVDFRVMLTFFEFYETLLGFVLFKLYNDIGVRYPLPVTDIDVSESTSVLVANLHILSRILREAKGAVSTAVSEAVASGSASKNDSVAESENDKANTEKKQKKSRDLLKSVDVALNKIKGDDTSDEDESDDEEDVDVATPLKDALEQMSQEEETTISNNNGAVLDDEATKRKRLFAGLIFFFSREVPKGYLELVSLAFGAKVGWEGDDSSISMKDPSITHFVMDRPKIPSSFENHPKSREYVQPQWILDCANFHFLLPCSRYGIGVELPPHLSPWVDNEEEGYTPAYAEEIERLKNGENISDMQQESHSSGEGDNSKLEEDDDIRNEDKEEQDSNATTDDSTGDEDESEEENEKEASLKAERRKLKEEEEAKILAKGMMSKKAARLYGRMQHGIAKKQANVDLLQRKRKEIELEKGKTADGKTPLKAKVERLKKERKTIEKDYDNTGGSMKKKKRRISN